MENIRETFTKYRKKKGIGYNLVFNCPCLVGFKPPWEFLFCTQWFFVYLY